MAKDAGSGKAAARGMESMEEVKRVFGRFDADGDGKISPSELGTVVRALGSHASPEEVRTMIDEMDSNHDGFVDFQEFADFHRRRSGGEGEDYDRELKDAFEMYDLDNNGLISAEELHLVLKRLGDKCSTRDCSRMIRSVDGDGDGSVNFVEFKRMMTAGVDNKAANPSPSTTSQ